MDGTVFITNVCHKWPNVIAQHERQSSKWLIDYFCALGGDFRLEKLDSDIKYDLSFAFILLSPVNHP